MQIPTKNFRFKDMADRGLEPMKTRGSKVVPRQLEWVVEGRIVELRFVFDVDLVQTLPIVS